VNEVTQDDGFTHAGKGSENAKLAAALERGKEIDHFQAEVEDCARFGGGALSGS